MGNLNANRYSVFIANFANYGSDISNETLTINVIQSIDNDLKAPKSANIYRIDQENANPLGKWDSIDRPVYPTMEQMNALNESTQVVPTGIKWKVINSNTVQFDVMIPSYGVAL